MTYFILWTASFLLNEDTCRWQPCLAPMQLWTTIVTHSLAHDLTVPKPSNETTNERPAAATGSTTHSTSSFLLLIPLLRTWCLSTFISLFYTSLLFHFLSLFNPILQHSPLSPSLPLSLLSLHVTHFFYSVHLTSFPSCYCNTLHICRYSVVASSCSPLGNTAWFHS